MTAPPYPEQVFLMGWQKRLIYARVALHVVFHFAHLVLRRRMPLRIYPRFLYRAALFLATVRHSKVVKRGGRYKLHLYVPAYPTPAFFHTLGKLHRPQPGPVSVVFSITRACSYRCPHCYQARDRGNDLEIERLIKTAGQMQDRGVSLFDIEGGEPLLRFDRLLRLIRAIDHRAEIWINTTGAGLSRKMTDQLMTAGLDGVMVSLHAPDPVEHDRFTGIPGSFKVACDALEFFAARGAFTAINCCPSGEMIASGGLEALLCTARKLRCSYVQVIHRKPAGAWLADMRQTYETGELIARLHALHRAYNSRPDLREFPSVAAQVFDEQPGLFGCTAGGVDRFYLGADGEVQPCEFLNVSFGNVRDEDFGVIFERMRAHFARPGTDWLCCTQAASIADAIREHQLKRTPVPWPMTRQLVASWRRGRATPLYRKLGIYR